MVSEKNETRRDAASLDMLRHAAIACAVASLFLLAFGLFWFAGGMMMLLFAAILVGILLDDASSQSSRIFGLKHHLALPLTLLLIFMLVGGTAWVLVPRIAQQTDQLMATIPTSIHKAGNYLAQYQWGRLLLKNLPTAAGTFTDSSMILSRISSIFSGLVGALGNFLVVTFIAIYLAARPEAYVNGMLKLLPQHARPRGRDVMRELAATLRLWLRGKIFSMVIIGILTTVGLMLLGVPLALTIGVIAGLLDFIPYVGPILAAIPAVLIALSQDPMQALYVILLFVLLQSIEGYLLLPLVERRTVSMLPGLSITMQVLFGLAFGLVGVALATPATAVLTVLVGMLYVQDVLGDRVQLPGDH